MTRLGRELHRLAETTPPYQDRHMDLLRAAAIGAVVIGHWLAIVVSYDERNGLTGRSVLEVLPWTHLLSWLFQVMPVFFLVGGFANAASLTSHLRRGGDATSWLLSRTGRLLRPTTVFLVVLASAALAAQVVGADPELVGIGVWLATIPLWFLVAYASVVVLTPPMHALHRRAGLAVPIALVALVGLGDLVRLALGIPYLGEANYLFAWLAVHQAGFAWFDGRLANRPPVSVPLAVGGFGALMLLTVRGPYPISMVNVPGEEVQNAGPPTLALLALATTQLGLAMLLHDRTNRWLQRPRVWTAVVGVNSVILTVFLWHMAAAVVATLLLHGTGFWTPAPVGSAEWYWGRLPWLATLTVLLAALVALFGRVEMRGTWRPGRDELRGTRARMVLTLAGLAGVLSGLLGVTVAGPGRHGPFGLPTPVLLAYLLGIAALELARRRAAAPVAPGRGRPGGSR
jgi:fucose 4-O-acetylase-like acetyltransferase